MNSTSYFRMALGTFMVIAAAQLTGCPYDLTEPMLSSTDPVEGAIDVPVNKQIVVIFNEAMDPLTITTATFTLDQGTTPVSGTVTYAGVTATFTPEGGLAPNTTYTATVWKEATDLAGNPLASDYVWTFRTGEDSLQYDLGFAAGFAEDEEYWMGFDDSMDTVDFGPIYYQGSTIPVVEYPAYDAGYWDGVWYAYNDGYFVAYDYAFTIGFSEGYDLAFYPDWEDFLAADEHVEYADGGWSDGYNDGFSEGRVFGAWDYDDGRAFDWLDAMLDYRDGTDVTIGGVSTGDQGPVYLYVYGTDPAEGLKSVRRARGVASGPVPAIRKSAAAKADPPALSYRPLINTVVQEFSVTPLLSPRSTFELTLETSWLDRVNAYRSALESPAKAVKADRVSNP